RPHVAKVSYLGITFGQNRTASDGPPTTANVCDEGLAGLKVNISELKVISISTAEALAPIRQPRNPRIARRHTRKDVMSGGIGLGGGVVVGSESISLHLRAEALAGEVNGFPGERRASLTQTTFDTRPRLQRQLVPCLKFGDGDLSITLLVHNNDGAIFGIQGKRESSIRSRTSDGNF